MITFPQLKAAAAAIAEKYNISGDDSRRIIGQYNKDNNPALSDVVAGDLSSVPAVAASLGIVSGKKIEGSTKKISRKDKPVKDRKQKTAIKDTALKDRKREPAAIDTAPVIDNALCDSTPVNDHAILETVAGEIVPDGMLPASITDDIENWLADFSQRYDIDLLKASGQQWRSACMYIGKHIQASGILLDMQRLKTHGGSKIYNPSVVAALLPIWEYITGLYKHVPLACDFIAFSGVSREWFYDSANRLTSSRVDLLKKAREIEESALSVAIADHRENPTGRIYYTKARLGWQETTTIQHVSVSAAAPAAALPVFGPAGEMLPEKTAGD